MKGMAAQRGMKGAAAAARFEVSVNHSSVTRQWRRRNGDFTRWRE